MTTTTYNRLTIKQTLCISHHSSISSITEPCDDGGGAVELVLTLLAVYPLSLSSSSTSSSGTNRLLLEPIVAKRTEGLSFALFAAAEDDDEEEEGLVLVVLVGLEGSAISRISDCT